MPCLRRIPSRRRPAPERPSRAARALGSLLCAVVLLGLVALLGWPAFAWPAGGWLVPAGFTVWLVLASLGAREHAERQRAARAGESICTFARAFPRRSVDTWTLRAVWEELDHVGYAVRADDRLEDVADVEGLELCLPELARRAGRSLEGVEQNPLFGRVTTVADLVHLLDAQPRG